MGLPAAKWRRREIEAPDTSIASRAETEGGSPCYHHGENSMGDHIERYSGPDLPKEMRWHIHSLMPMRDAARAACLSRDFGRSWRYHPDLTFSDETLGFNESMCGRDDKMRYFTDRVDRVMKQHSGIGVKSFKLQVGGVYNHKDCCHLDHIDSWLQTAVKPGIEELDLSLSTMNGHYNFPCTLLSGGTGESLRRLALIACSFFPSESCCLRSLTKLKLFTVHILEDNLQCLFSNTCALECLELHNCNLITCLKIPCLQKLSHLGVSSCNKLQSIESKAPNLSSFGFSGGRRVQLSLGDTLRIKSLKRTCYNAALYARTELPSIMPNIETLTICSLGEKFINTPMRLSRFPYLKFLIIYLPFQVAYDFYSLVSFFHASPSLETFILSVLSAPVERASIFADPSDLRMMHEQHHGNLKSVQIINFSSAKSLVELTCHILKFAMSLERLTLDTTSGLPRCSISKSGKCMLMPREDLVEAHKAVLAVQTYIKSKVPSTVELNVLEPCSQCHAEI